MKNKTEPQVTQATAASEPRSLYKTSLASAAAVFMALSASAGTFSADFNSGPPAATTIYGNAHILSSGGFTNSGCLQLTTNLASQNGSLVISNFDGGLPIVAFTAKFKVFIGGGTGADGMVFAFANNLPAGTFGGSIPDESVGTGLMVEFDTFSNANDVVGIDLWSGGGEFQSQPFTGLRAGTFVDAVVQLNPDGSLLVIYDGFYAYTNAFPGIGQITDGQFGFGARCGGSTDNHLVDNLTITTYTNGLAFVKYYSPIGRSLRADAPIDVVLSDALDPFTALPSQVDTNKIVLTLDGAQVSPSITQSAPLGTTLTDVHYPLPTIFVSGSSHTVSVMYADQSLPSVTNTWQWTFTVGTYPVLATNLVADTSLVSTNPGFALRISQIDASLGNTIDRFERQLANLLIDPLTSLPYPNLATLTSYVETNVVNYSQAGLQGDFQTEGPASIPGVPGSSGNSSNTVLEMVTYLPLTNGTLCTLGVNSSDGFRLAAASTPDAFAPVEMFFDNVRADADSTVTFAVGKTGFYPFRLLYFSGGAAQLNPTPGNPSVEFFSTDASGNRTLINDTNQPVFISAFQPAQTLPYIRSVSPGINASGISGNAPVDVILVDGSITVQTNTVQLLVNSNAVSPVITNNAGLTSVHYQPSSVFVAGSTNTLQIAFTDSAANRRTNVWQFIVSRSFNALWTINPGSRTNVTTSTTERGLGYNPKTGHVLLVSRANTLEVVILDGNTGAQLGEMNVSGISGGTFSLSSICIAEDGVIYAANLVTTSGSTFKVYRWQDESSAPSNIITASSNGRWGDGIRVRGSGAGTQLITGTDNATLPFWTTLDGTNFTLTILTITSGTSGGLRGGQGFGCGNTVYGKINGTAMPFDSFTGPPASTAASQTAIYTLVARGGSASPGVSCIAVDVVNQRIGGICVGSAANEADVYDISALTTSANNAPADAVSFPTSTTSSATGQSVFSPDGSRWYGLDSGNGIMGFSMSPKLAAPTICAQPRNSLLSPTNSVAFMDFAAIGAPQAIQWRFHGLNPANAAVSILNATNRTLDTYNVQQSNLGWYSVLITNSLGSVTSSVAMLDIQMVITNQPVGVAVTQGSSATFNVGVAGGAQSLSYQWRKNGVNIGSATTSSYTIPSADFTDAAYLGYSVLITDALTQAVTSASATLNVEPAVAAAPGSGTGLLGMYYTNAAYTTTTPPAPFTGLPATNRVDATVNFDFGNGSFDNVSFPYSTDYFQVRWVGQIQPLYSQAYTFFTTSDDGQRLWVNGTKLVDDWTTHGGTERTAPLAGTLVAGQKYDVVYEMYEKTVGAMAKLWWWSPSQIKTNIPMEQLYPGSGPLVPSFTTSLSNGTNLVMNWVGTCVLQSATNVTGPWLPLTTNAGPFTVNMTASPQHFYRLLSQQF